MHDAIENGHDLLIEKGFARPYYGGTRKEWEL